MPELDEVSQTLGRLEATMNMQTVMLNKMDDKLTLINGSVGKAHNRIDDVQGEMITKTGAFKFFLGAGLLGGAGSSGIISGIKAFLGL